MPGRVLGWLALTKTARSHTLSMNPSAIASSAISATCRLPPRMRGAANNKSRAARTATGPIGPVFCLATLDRVVNCC